MNVLLVTEARAAEWDALVQQEPAFSMLQSWDWGAFKQRLGWQVCRVAVEEAGALIAGAQMMIKPLPLGLFFAYVPRGPIGSWLDPAVAELLLPELSRLAGSRGAVFLKVEPPSRSDSQADMLLQRCGFHPTRVTNQPRSTILLDLGRGQADILQNMRKKTRQYVRRAEREGIVVRFGTSTDLPAYYELMRLTGKRDHFAARSPNYYQSEWEAVSACGRGALLLAYHEGRLIAARVVYRLGSHAAEFHAGSLIIPGLHPNYLLVWEAIKWAATNGCTTYDLWGIPDELAEADADEKPQAAERDGGLWGVYQFKRGFGSGVVSYVGAYDYIFAPTFYRLLNFALSRGKWWERVASMLDSPGGRPSPKSEPDFHGGDG